MNVVVGYATAHGLAREIAQRLATRLTASGVSARARPMGEVLDAAVFEVFVPGERDPRTGAGGVGEGLPEPLQRYPPLSLGVDVPREMPDTLRRGSAWPERKCPSAPATSLSASLSVA
jgi:hypothetical protein